jgi:hypothetical protein
MAKSFLESQPAEHRTSAVIVLCGVHTAKSFDSTTCAFPLLIRKLLYLGCFGPQTFSANPQSFLSEFCLILRRVIAESDSFARKKVLSESIVIGLLSFCQDLIQTINSELIEVVLELSDAIIMTTATLLPFFEFFARCCIRFPDDPDSTLFSRLIRKLEWSIRQIPGSPLLCPLMHHILAVLVSEKKQSQIPIRCDMFNLMCELRSLNAEVATFLADPMTAGFIIVFLSRGLLSVPFPEAAVSLPDFPDRMAELEVASGPIERTFEADFPVLANRTLRSKPIEMPGKPELPDLAQLLIGSILNFSIDPAVNLRLMGDLMKDQALSLTPIVPIFLCAWICQLDLANVEDVVIPLAEIQFHTFMLEWSFLKWPDKLLQDFILDFIRYLTTKTMNEQPFFISDLLNFVLREIKRFRLNSKLCDCVCDCAIGSPMRFVESCRLIGFCDKMTFALRKLSALKENETKKEVLRMIDTINSLPLVFQYFFDVVGFCDAILLYFYDPSTVAFATAQVSCVFQFFRTGTPVLMSVIDFFQHLPLNEQIVTHLLHLISQGCECNKPEIVFLFDNTSFLDYLISSAAKLNQSLVLPLFLELFSSLQLGDDVFVKLAKISKNFDTEVVAMLWRIVFQDDDGMGSIRPFANPSPLSFIFRTIGKGEDRLFDFLLFVSNCLQLRPDCAYEIAVSDFPAQLLERISEFRTKTTTTPLFDLVLNLFKAISSFTIKTKDLVGIFWLCTSLPGHVRPAFTRRIVSVLNQLFTVSDEISAFFSLKGDGHIQLPQLSLDVVNDGFSLCLDIRLLDAIDDIEGDFFEFSGPSSLMSAGFAGRQMIFSSVINSKPVCSQMSVPVPCKTWVRLFFVFRCDSFDLVIPGHGRYSVSFEKQVYVSNFTHFQVIMNIRCTVAYYFQ